MTNVISLLNTKTDDSAHSGILPSVTRIDFHMWTWVQATLCITSFSIPSLSPSQSPGIPAVPVVPSGGVQSPAGVHVAGAGGGCWKSMSVVSPSVHLSAQINV